MKIAIARPVLDGIEALSERSLFEMIGATRGHQLFYTSCIGCSIIHEARNELVRQAYKYDFDAILMIDADMVFPADTLNRLIDHDKPIVGVLYSSRVKENLPNVFDYRPDKNQYIRKPLMRNTGLHKVDAIGTGIILIKREVIEAVRSPYFFFSSDFSEDINFCHRAKECGYDSYCDTDLSIGHIGKTQYVMK